MGSTPVNRAPISIQVPSTGNININRPAPVQPLRVSQDIRGDNIRHSDDDLFNATTMASTTAPVRPNNFEAELERLERDRDYYQQAMDRENLDYHTWNEIFHLHSQTSIRIRDLQYQRNRIAPARSNATSRSASGRSTPARTSGSDDEGEDLADTESHDESGYDSQLDEYEEAIENEDSDAEELAELERKAEEIRVRQAERRSKRKAEEENPPPPAKRAEPVDQRGFARRTFDGAMEVGKAATGVLLGQGLRMGANALFNAAPEVTSNVLRLPH